MLLLSSLVGGLGGWLIWLKMFCSSGLSPQVNAGLYVYGFVPETDPNNT